MAAGVISSRAATSAGDPSVFAGFAAGGRETGILEKFPPGGPKVLEAMQEFSITYGGQTYPLDRPFFILATQNPIEQAGTYPLPEAQLDRFLLYIKIGYPSAEEELAMFAVLAVLTCFPAIRLCDIPHSFLTATYANQNHRLPTPFA